MKFIKNKYELSEFSLLLIWFQCEPHWWCYTRQKKTDLIPNISRHLPSTDSQASGMRILNSRRFWGTDGEQALYLICEEKFSWKITMAEMD